MIEAGASPEAIAKVMVQQEILNTIGKSPDEMSKILLKQLRSGKDISLDDLTKLLSSGGISLEDAGKVTLLQKALTSLNIPIEEIARAALLQKGLLENGTSMEDILENLSAILREKGLDLNNLNIEKLIVKGIEPAEIMGALQLDKVLEAGGVTMTLSKDNACDKTISDAIKDMLHSNDTSPQGLIGKLSIWLQRGKCVLHFKESWFSNSLLIVFAGSVLIQKIMSGLNLPPDSVAKMILLEKNLYDSGTSPQDIIQLLQMVSENQQANLLAMSSDLKLTENLTETDLESICDLIDAFRGAKVTPELTSKIILLQKAIESSIVSPESTIAKLAENLKAPGANPIDFTDAFNAAMKKNNITSKDVDKAALIQRAAVGAGVEASAFGALLDIQNALLEAGFSQEDITSILKEMLDGEDFESISKAMQTTLETSGRLKEEDLSMGLKIADAIDRSALKGGKFAKLLAKQDLKNVSVAQLPSLLKSLLSEANGPSNEALARALGVMALMANNEGQAENLAKALRISNGLIKSGVAKSNVSRLLHEVTNDPSMRKQNAEELKKPLSNLKSLVFDSKWIDFFQRYQSAMTETCANVDNLKEIFENAMCVVGLTKEDVAKAAMVQRTLNATGVTPAILAQAVLFQRALAASGLSAEEILGVLSKVTSPKFTEDEIKLLLTKALEKKSVSKEDIEAISQMQQALRSGGGFGLGDGELSQELQVRTYLLSYIGTLYNFVRKWNIFFIASKLSRFPLKNRAVCFTCKSLMFR